MPEPLKDATGTLKSVLAAGGGVFVYCLSRFLASLAPARSSLAERSNPLIETWTMVLGRFEVQFALFIIFAFLAVIRRDQPKGWIPAFLAGMGLAYVVLHWVA